MRGASVGVTTGEDLAPDFGPVPLSYLLSSRQPLPEHPPLPPPLFNTVEPKDLVTLSEKVVRRATSESWFELSYLSKFEQPPLFLDDLGLQLCVPTIPERSNGQGGHERSERQ